MAVEQPTADLMDSHERTLQLTKDRYESSKTAYDSIKNAWLLCIAFYLGRHYVFYEPTVGLLTDIPNQPTTKGHALRLREIRNHLSPLVNMWCALVTETEPVFTAKPKSGDEKDYLKALQASHALEHTADRVDLEWKLAVAAKWVALCGNAGLLPFWDASARGGRGDFGLDVVSPFDIYPPQGATTIDDCQYIQRIHSMRLDHAKKVFPEHADKITADTSWQVDRYAGKLLETVTGISTPSSQVKDRVVLIESWDRRGAEYPEGRHTITSADLVLLDRPYPSDRLGMQHWLCNIVPGRFFGRSFVVDELSPQRAVNDNASRMREWTKNMSTIVRLVANQAGIPIGEYFAGEPAENIPFNAFGGDPVRYLEYPQPPASLERYMAGEVDGMANIANIHDSSMGKKGPGERSARQIAYRQAADARSLAETLKSLNVALKRSGRMYLEMWRGLVGEPQAVSFLGDDGRYATEMFFAGDLDEDIEVEVGSLAPRNKAVEEDAIRADYASGILDRDEARRGLRRAGHIEQFYENPDRETARDEWKLLAQGIQAETKPYYDHNVHWHQHREDAIRALREAPPSPDAQQVIDAHIATHSDQIQAAMMQFPQQGGQEAPQRKGQPGGNPDQQGGGGQNWGLDMNEEIAQGQQ